jgi:hypothetical protein
VKSSEVYMYRGEVANNAIKMAGQEVGLFVERAEVTHRNRDFEELSDEELLRKLRDEANALLLENQARNNGDSEG